jgi:hypothetical protein
LKNKKKIESQILEEEKRKIAIGKEKLKKMILKRAERIKRQKEMEKMN